MEWIAAAFVLAVGFALNRCADQLKRIADVAERKERMQRDADAIAASIGSDVARNLEQVAGRLDRISNELRAVE